MTTLALSDAQIAALTDDEVDECLALEESVEGAESLDTFIRRVSPTRPPPRHFAPLLALLERAKRERLRVCISMPPRHAKTTFFQHAIVWWMSRNAVDTHGYFSYNEQQGLSKSGKIRDLAIASDIRLAPDTVSKHEWRTTSGGGLLAGGVGTGLTGQGVSGLMIVDDPFKDRASAESVTIRDNVEDWFNDVVMTRLEGASVFVVHTRWHQDDLIGRLEKQGGWEILNLPALAEEGDPLGRAEGEALWPTRYDAEYLAKTKRQIGEYSFAALYQGRPVPRGAKLFGAAHYYQPGAVDLFACMKIIAADPAGSEKTSADYSAAVVLAIKGRDPDTMVAYVLEVYRHQVTQPQFADDLLALQRRHSMAPIHVESVGGFKAIPQMLRRLNSNIRLKEIVPIGDKFTRAQGAAAAWNDARLLVPDGEEFEWLGDFLDELGAFTGVKDAHDDQVDALAHAWNSMRPGPIKYTGPRKPRERRI